jgi:hypothetical protein
MRGRSLVTCSLGVAIFDYPAPSSSTERTPRIAGIFPPYYLVSTAAAYSAGAGAMADDRHCHCVAVIRRKFSDGYEIVSAPGVAAHTVTSGTGTDDNKITHSVFFDTRFTKVGDIVEIYRTRSQEFGTTRVNTGSDYYLAKSLSLSATDISNSFATVVDVTPDSALGDALYTNDGVQGSESAALVPPTCTSMAVFRNHTFYLCITDPPIFSVKNTTFWGPMLSTAGAGLRASGYGDLRVTAGLSVTSGSPVVSGFAAGVTDNVVAGQSITVTPGPSGYVLSKTATTVTVSANSAATNASSQGRILDVFEVDGVSVNADTIASLSAGLGPNYLASCLSRVVSSADPGFTNPSTVPADKCFIAKKTMWGQTLPTMTVRATRGNLLDPPLPRIENSETATTYTTTAKPNAFTWSEENQPENCPATNTAFCGTGTIYAGYATRDALWIFASDGLWRLSGTGGQAGRGYDWRLDPIDSTLILSGPQAGCVLRDKVYAMTSRGFVAIDSSGNVIELSDERIDDQLLAAGWPSSSVSYDTTGNLFLVPDEVNNEVIIKQRDETDTLTLWRYNATTDAFTKDKTPTAPMHGVFFDYYRKPMLLQVGTGRIDFLVQDTTTFNTADLTYQPLFASSPFDMHHWQTVNVAAESNTASLLVYVGTTLIGTRSMVAGDSSIYSRRSFGVPRSAPAVSNNIQLRIVGGSSSQQFKLLGVEVVHQQLTGQRKDR